MVRVTEQSHRLPETLWSLFWRYSRNFWMPICEIYYRVPALAGRLDLISWGLFQPFQFCDSVILYLTDLLISTFWKFMGISLGKVCILIMLLHALLLSRPASFRLPCPAKCLPWCRMCAFNPAFLILAEDRSVLKVQSLVSRCFLIPSSFNFLYEFFLHRILCCLLKQ